MMDVFVYLLIYILGTHMADFIYHDLNFQKLSGNFNNFIFLNNDFPNNDVSQ